MSSDPFFSKEDRLRASTSDIAWASPNTEAPAAELSWGCRILVFVVFTQIVQGLMSYDGGATQFCTSFLAARGWSAMELGLLGAMDKFGQVATAFLCGEMLVRYNAKGLLIIGLFWKAACCMVFGVLQQVSNGELGIKVLMLTAKLGMGISEALVSVWATVWVQCNAPPDAKARWLGFAGTSAGVGSGVGSGVASLWSPSWAFICQALCLGVVWIILLVTPHHNFRINSAAEEENLDMGAKMESSENPALYLYEWVGHRLHHHQVILIESVRLKGHYLDASESPLDEGFRVRITKGDPCQGDWALFRLIESPGGIITLESVRIPGYVLDCTCERVGLLDHRRKVRLSEGDPSQKWAQFRMHCYPVLDDSVSFESVQYPGHYLDASGERLTRGTKVRVTEGDPSEAWARFIVRDYINDVVASKEGGISLTPGGGLSKPLPMGQHSTFVSSLRTRMGLVLTSRLWLWTAMSISWSCFVTSGISFLWQNTLESIWGFDDAWSFLLFLFSTGFGGMFGVVLGPKLFDGLLGGFALPAGKARCLAYCQHIHLAVALAGTMCATLLILKTYFIVHYNFTFVVYWELAVLVVCVFFIFMGINALLGTLYGINTDASTLELRTFAAGMTVAFQNIFGFACGPLIPGAFASVVSQSVMSIWPTVEWDGKAIDGAQYAAGMSLAFLSTWGLFLFTGQASVRARLLHISASKQFSAGSGLSLM